MKLFKGITEGPRRGRQLVGAFLFGHEWIVANPDTRFGVTSGSPVIRPERCDDECFGYPNCPLISQIVDNPFGNLLTSTWFEKTKCRNFSPVYGLLCGATDIVILQPK